MRLYKHLDLSNQHTDYCVAEVIRNFEPVVRDTVTMPGNVAVFNCHIPGVSYNENNVLPESVAITSWVQDGVFNIFPSWEIGESTHIIILLLLEKKRFYPLRIVQFRFEQHE